MGDNGNVCALCCTKSDPKKMSMCDKWPLQHCTDCIDCSLHTCKPRKYPIFRIPPDASFPAHFSTGYLDTNFFY